MISRGSFNESVSSDSVESITYRIGQVSNLEGPSRKSAAGAGVDGDEAQAQAIKLGESSNRQKRTKGNFHAEEQEGSGTSDIITSEPEPPTPTTKTKGPSSNAIIQLLETEVAKHNKERKHSNKKDKKKSSSKKEKKKSSKQQSNKNTEDLSTIPEEITLDSTSHELDYYDIHSDHGVGVGACPAESSDQHNHHQQQQQPHQHHFHQLPQHVEMGDCEDDLINEQCIFDRGNYLATSQKYDDARLAFITSLKIRSKLFGRTHEYLAPVYEMLGHVERKTGNFSMAVNYFIAALNILGARTKMEGEGRRRRRRTTTNNNSPERPSSGGEVAARTRVEIGCFLSEEETRCIATRISTCLAEISPLVEAMKDVKELGERSSRSKPLSSHRGLAHESTLPQLRTVSSHSY